MTEQHSHRPYHIVVVAAGRGVRLGGDVPKQYLSIGGKPLLRHTLENILSWHGCDGVHVVIHPDHRDLYEKAAEGLDVSSVIEGGAERQDSVKKALLALASTLSGDEIVLIHDAARPFTSAQDVSSLLDSFINEGVRAASLARPVSDSLRNEQNDTVDRHGLWAMQTPQAFYFGDLQRAHEAGVSDQLYTDDASLVSALGIDVKLVVGAQSNFKITTKDDLVMAQALLNNTYEIRTGMGFDVHAFENAPSERVLKLCGVVVEHDLALAGHSDADVGLHTITDALLGAIGEGDIGHHFPPSDDTFKDMDSAVFLKKAMDMLRAKGGVVHNIDVTLICEAPKVGPYREEMAERIAQICGVVRARVNVKATTTERLGFTGRKEGIAAQAVVTVKLPAVEE